MTSPLARGRLGRTAPSDRVVVGLVGAGEFGCRRHLPSLLAHAEVHLAAVCDVDNGHLRAAEDLVRSHSGRAVTTYYDFRDLCDSNEIDAVVIAVPDHWHALVAVYAIEAGKDVYLEKPLGLTIAEGRQIADAAARYGTVFQSGLQQRSDPRFRHVCELVRNGRLGTIERIDVAMGGTEPGVWTTSKSPPRELDWNAWLGPAVWSEYASHRCHYQFRWFSEYSGGKLTDWGVHYNDIVQWALNMDRGGPTQIRGQATWHAEGPHDVPCDFEVVFRYPQGAELYCCSQGRYGIRFAGSKGWVFVSRTEWEASDPDWLASPLTPGPVRLYASDDHLQNWLDCMRTRRPTITDAETGHRSSAVCHLGNIALHLRRQLAWNPQTEQFIGDELANRLISRPMRAPWHL